jgi:hypothetical protein
MRARREALFFCLGDTLEKIFWWVFLALFLRGRGGRFFGVAATRPPPDRGGALAIKIFCLRSWAGAARDAPRSGGIGRKVWPCPRKGKNPPLKGGRAADSRDRKGSRSGGGGRARVGAQSTGRPWRLAAACPPRLALCGPPAVTTSAKCGVLMRQSFGAPGSERRREPGHSL